MSNLSEKEIIKDLNKYISFANKNENFSNDNDFKWNVELSQRIKDLLDLYNEEVKISHYLQSELDIANAKLIEEKEKNKELTDKLKDCDLHYSKLYKFHNNNCVTKDRINQIIDELIKLYFEEDSYCFSGFMFNNKTFNSLNIKEEMTVMQLLKHLQRLLKQEEE